MNLLFLSITGLLIWLNLAGLGLLLRRLTPHYALARAVAVVGLCLFLFFLEHFVGLGHLQGLWPITTGTALLLCWRGRLALRQNWRLELGFVLAFSYGFAWRFMFPNIDASSERLTDLGFIVNYLPGERLPPLDNWLPPYRFDFYYAFQHYSAALLGRLFGLDSGTTYNFAFCVMVGLIISMAWLVISLFCRRRTARYLVLFAFVLGGTGVSPLLHLLFAPAPSVATQGTDIPAPPPDLEQNLWRSTRFIGSMDAGINTAFGHRIFPPADLPAGKTTPTPALDLPLETFSYLVYLGDFHPPLGGLLLLLIALACIGLLEQQPANRFAQALLAGSVPVTLITNAWVFPLQTALALTWIGYRHCRQMAPDWKMLALGSLLAAALIYPALSGLAGQALSLELRLVPWPQHTPWRQFLALFWPLLALLLLSLSRRARSPVSLMLFSLWGLLLLLSETLYFDDLYSSQYERFNTVLKCWAWIYSGALLTLGASTIGSTSRLARRGGALVMLLICAYSIDLGRFYWWLPKNAVGQFHGHAWLSANAGNQAMLNFLKIAPPGIVLSRNDKAAYSSAPAFAMFAGKPALLGWSDHEWTWRGSPAHIPLLASQVADFYRGNLIDSLPWLLQHEVRYIVWTEEDARTLGGAFNNIRQQIGSRYDWRAFLVTGDIQAGLWLRRAEN